jgi:hypothetical protein
VREKDDEMTAKTKLLESILEEYKDKIQNLIAVNENSFHKVKEFENKNKLLQENLKSITQENKQIEAGRLAIEIELNNVKKNYQKELKANSNIQGLIQKIKTCSAENNSLRQQMVKLFEKLNIFFQSKGRELSIDHINSQEYNFVTFDCNK